MCYGMIVISRYAGWMWGLYYTKLLQLNKFYQVPFCTVQWMSTIFSGQ